MLADPTPSDTTENQDSIYVFQDIVLDNQAKSKFPQEYLTILSNRAARQEAAYEVYSGQAPTSKFLLSSLENLINKLSNPADGIISAEDRAKINFYQEQIDNSNTYLAGSAEDQQMQEYFQNISTGFQWPDQNELAIRTQEEAELKNLLDGTTQ